MNYSERIKQQKQRNADKLAELDRERLIAEALPEGALEPYLIHMASSNCPWVSYHVKTLAEALAIALAFPTPLDVSARERGCVSIQPTGHHSKEYDEGKERWSVPQCIEIAQHGGRGFYSATVSFWCVAGGRELIKVCLDVKEFPWQYRAHVSANYDRHGEIISAEFRDSGLRELAPGARIKYGSGSRDAFDIRYYFSGTDGLAKVVGNTTAKEAA